MNTFHRLSDAARGMGYMIEIDQSGMGGYLLSNHEEGYLAHRHTLPEIDELLMSLAEPDNPDREEWGKENIGLGFGMRKTPIIRVVLKEWPWITEVGSPSRTKTSAFKRARKLRDKDGETRPLRVWSTSPTSWHVGVSNRGK